MGSRSRVVRPVQRLGRLIVAAALAWFVLAAADGPGSPSGPATPDALDPTAPIYVLEATGVVNGVVNVAGITRDARIPKKSFDDFKLVVGVHLYGTFLFLREVAAQCWHVQFKNAGNQPLDDGVNRFVVNFSSVSARNGNVGQIDYTAAKGAIESATKTAAREFSAYRARVNAIAPGPVNTPMLAAVGEEGIKAMGRATLTGRLRHTRERFTAECGLTVTADQSGSIREIAVTMGDPDVELLLAARHSA